MGFALHVQVLAQWIDAIEHVGITPYHLLEPVLRRASPEQLARFESFNPVRYTPLH